MRDGRLTPSVNVWPAARLHAHSQQRYDGSSGSQLMTDKADVNSLSASAYFLLESTDGPPK
jgi:hypothetical protein